MDHGLAPGPGDGVAVQLLGLGRGGVDHDDVRPQVAAALALLREQILRAAYEVAVRSGIDGVTVRGVACTISWPRRKSSK